MNATVESLERSQTTQTTQTTPLRFALEPYSEKLVQEMRPLWDAHYKEIAQYEDIPLEPDLTAYRHMQQRDVLRIYTARIWTGWESSLVGYNVFFVATNPHYKSSLQAVQDLLFLNEDLRHGLIGYKFIAWCDEQLRKEKVQVVHQHLKAAHNFGQMLERQRYRLVDLIYSKRLDQEK